MLLRLHPEVLYALSLVLHLVPHLECLEGCLVGHLVLVCGVGRAEQ